MSPYTLTWHATSSGHPDADMTVLLWIRYDDGTRDCAAGWWDAQLSSSAATLFEPRVYGVNGERLPLRQGFQFVERASGPNAAANRTPTAAGREGSG